jgi:hypothetical protein
MESPSIQTITLDELRPDDFAGLIFIRACMAAGAVEPCETHAIRFDINGKNVDIRKFIEAFQHNWHEEVTERARQMVRLGGIYDALHDLETLVTEKISQISATLG